MTALLVVTAVAVEADALAAALGPVSVQSAMALPARQVVTAPGSVDIESAMPRRRIETASGSVEIVAGGVGPAAAAATTAWVLAGQHYDLVLSAGIAGGFAPTSLGDVVVADAVVQADLGAEDGPVFRPASELGLGAERTDLDPQVTRELARRCNAGIGAVLSVSTVTGTAATAARRLAQTPDACAEAMEGAGVLAGAVRAGVAFGEVRAISNLVGPRDRVAWDIPLALRALAGALVAITSSEWTL